MHMVVEILCVGDDDGEAFARFSASRIDHRNPGSEHGFELTEPLVGHVGDDGVRLPRVERGLQWIVFGRDEIADHETISRRCNLADSSGLASCVFVDLGDYEGDAHELRCNHRTVPTNRERLLR